MQYKITGDHGIRLVGPASSKVAILACVLLATSFIVTFVLYYLEGIGIIQPQVNPGKAGIIIGVVACLAGTTVTVISQFQMGAAWRFGVDESEKTNLITNGLYSLIRNPIYSGVMLFAIGLLILLPHIDMLIGIFMFYLAIELQVRFIEEPHLHRLHGTAYENYANQVGRYLPKLVHGIKMS